MYIYIYTFYGQIASTPERLRTGEQRQEWKFGEYCWKAIDVCMRIDTHLHIYIYIYICR